MWTVAAERLLSLRQLVVGTLVPMTAIWQHRDDEWRLLAPSGFPDEATLHTQIEEAPQLLPLAGSPLLAVVGREVRLGTGYADLIAVEDSGRPVVIEVKLASNSEARRAVVAQVLAYAAYMFGLTASEFERGVLGRHLRDRNHDSVFGAVSAVDQAGRIDDAAFTEALEANLAAGRFRLVLVLDEAPDELVKLVGYLEAVTPELVIDLVTVSMYEVGGSTVLVPQRVDPERAESGASAPTAARTEGVGYSTEGVTDFAALVDAAPEEAQPQLRRMCQWVAALDAQNLVGNVWTYHGTTYVTLLPRLPVDDAGLVTIYYSDTGGSMTFWRSVFERRAPNSLPAVEAAAAPAKVGQGKVTYDVSDDLLDALTEAYREAMGNIRS
jgi:hypothetical protein